MKNPVAIQLSKQAFWDVDMRKLDYEKQANAIIEKVFEWGSWEDIGEISAFYSEEKIKYALINAHYLMEKTMYFASQIYNIPLKDFKCYTTKQYHPIL